MWDLHCHILPGIDDGAKDREEALAMARMLSQQGVAAVAATPHFPAGERTVTAETVLAAVEALQTALQREEIGLAVYPGMEAMLSPSLPELVRSGKALTLGNTGRYLLVELPFGEVPLFSEAAFFSLLLAGITPVLAHPERNVRLAGQPDLLARWVERGVLVQLNAGSLTGAYGQAARRAAETFLLWGMAHCVASDSHTVRKKLPVLTAAQQTVFSLCGAEVTDALFVYNPQQIISGREMTVPVPQPVSRLALLGKRLKRTVSGRTRR